MPAEAIIDEELLTNKIHFIRCQKVILDKDLAHLYHVTTGNLNKAVKRNIERFPDDFMFQLNIEEASRFQFGILKKGQNMKYLPFAFTEQGVAMLSGVLTSQRAIQVNLAIIRLFIKMRQMLSTNLELLNRLDRYRHLVFAQICIGKLAPSPLGRGLGWGILSCMTMK